MKLFALIKRNENIIKWLILSILLIGGYLWKGIPMVASVIVGYLIIWKYSHNNLDEEE